MNKIYLIILLFVFSIPQSFAQTPVITGKVQDQSSQLPIKNAIVMVLSEKDSILQGFTRTADDGSFTLQIKSSGNKILMISNSLYAEYVDNIKISQTTENLKTIRLTNKSKLLEAIIIKTGGSIKIKGDTTIYTADSFNVSANANVEELLKKLPGIQVDKNGEIKAMGEKVEKVLVDGEEFFGDDPGMAVKNLRADAVKEVQVFDKKSEASTFSGIDDGNTKKTINLKLKEDKKKGYFGKLSLAGGIGQNIDNRFNNNLMFGSFKGKRKLSAFFLNGNISQDGLNWQENQKYSGEENNFEMMDEDGIFGFTFQGNGSDEDININTQYGFLRNINAGVSYSNKWNDKHSINFSPKYNLQDYNNIKNTQVITQIGDSILDQQTETKTNLNRYNFKSSFIFDTKIDSANTLKLTLRADNYHSNSIETSDAETSGSSGIVKNASFRSQNKTSDKTVITANLIFKHKFKKARRTLSLTADVKTNSTESDSYLQSSNRIFEQAIPFSVELDQLTKTNNTGTNLSAKALYTEPLTKKWSMEMSYQLAVNAGNNDQKTYTPNATNVYNVIEDSLTNDFKQNITIQTPSTRFNYAYKKIKFNFGSGFGITHFSLLDKTIDKTYIRDYINLFPSATFVYAYKGNHSLRIKYNGSNTQPTINQLQPLRNNNNFFNQYEGNPDLKPSFSNNFNITHNGYNFLKELWNYQTLNVSFTNNSIANNKTIDAATGKTITKPINTNGNVNVSMWSGVGLKWKKPNINCQFNGNINYFRYADVINNLISFSNTTSAGVSVTFNKSKSNKYDFGFSNNFDVNRNTNAQSKTVNSFRSNTMSANATVYYKKAWSIISDYQMFARQKLSATDKNISINTLNIQLQKTFKNNEYTLYVKVKDLLNQNIGIERNYSSNTFVEERNQQLRRYFMLGFTWDFKNKNNAKK